jgi:O-antigen chain-terminating methyltransferase
MTSDGLDALGRQRRDADGRYNAALTALDEAVVAASRAPSIGREHRELVATTLMMFLQQITAFVETKDRELAATVGARIDQVERDAQSLGELRTHVGVLQRAMEMLKRSAIGQPAAAGRPQSATRNPQPAFTSPQPPAPSPQSDDYKYVGFEDQFRGTDAAVEERLQAYVPIFAGQSDVLDVGCGRGEFLAALKTAGIPARGIDANAGMTAVAQGRGLDASHADALAFIGSLPDNSLGGIIAVQVVEHLDPAYLMRLLDAMARALRRGAPIVIETINPACWLAFFSSYIRDFTHVRPVHPETLQYLLRASGFERVETRYSAPVPDQIRMKTIDLPADVLASADPMAIALARSAHAANANAVILNNLLFSYLDYAAIGYRS